MKGAKMQKRGKSERDRGQPAAKTKRRARFDRGAYETAHALDVLHVLPEQDETFALLADLLAMWTRHLLDCEPSAAGHIYRALREAWRDYRVEHEDEPRDRLNTCHHGAMLDRLDELTGTPQELPITEWNRQRSAKLTAVTRPALAAMLARVELAAAPYGEAATPPAHAAPTFDGNVWAELGGEFGKFLDRVKPDGEED